MQESVEPEPQTFAALPEAELTRIRSDAGQAKAFVKVYVPDTSYSMTDFDTAFRIWQRESPRRYPANEVVAMMGAYLGEKLANELDMEWVIVTDEYGRDLAVRSKKVEVVSYPYSSVTKRVERNQYDFMEGIYHAVQEMILNGEVKTR
jgi:hypothetical protein